MKGISTCPNCHIQFNWERASTVPPARYCSNKCRLEHKKAKVSIYGKSNCEQCGKEFSWKRPIHQGPAKRCSRKCNPEYLKGKELWEYTVKLYNEMMTDLGEIDKKKDLKTQQLN